MTDMTDQRKGVEPIVAPIKGGWAAYGNGWAVHAPTRDEVIHKFREREALYLEVDQRSYWNERFHKAVPQEQKSM